MYCKTFFEICTTRMMVFIIAAISEMGAHGSAVGNSEFTQALAAKYGHPTQEYNVTTEDGYILSLHRLPGRGMPILLVHGLMDTSESWLRRGEQSLGIVLASMGHDVWLGDCRGNLHSRGHVSLDAEKDSEIYWDFTFDEIGYYDLPAFIDFILNTTGYQKLNGMGHSQGSTIFFIMGSLRTEYNDKVNAFIALAPIAFLDNLKFPMSVLAKFGTAMYNLAVSLKQYELLGNSPTGEIIQSICLQPIIGYFTCAFGIIFVGTGLDPLEYEYPFHYDAFQTYPASTSAKSLYHFCQINVRSKFAQFDYGVEENMKRYGSESPPEYDLSKVTMPIALMSAKNDKLSVIDDVVRLRDSLPNVIQFTVLERALANHVDYLWGRTNYKYVYPHIFDIMSKYF